MCRFNVLDRKPIREGADPRSLEAHGGLEGLSACIRENNELGSTVMGIGLERDEPFLLQVVDNPLHILAIRTEVASEPRHGLRALGGDDRPKDLPAGTRQPKVTHQSIPRRRWLAQPTGSAGACCCVCSQA